jgi:hypothetical protein
MRSIFVTTKTRRLIYSSILASLIAAIILAMGLLSVRADWVNAQAAYNDWINGGKKQNCEQLYNDSIRQFKELDCKPANTTYFNGFRCEDPSKEDRRNEINDELRQSSCPINPYSTIDDILLLDPPKDQSLIEYLWGLNSSNQQFHMLTSLPLLALFIFIFLSLIQGLILEKHPGWFRLTISLSVFSAAAIPLLLYITDTQREFFPELAVISFLSLVGVAALIIYGRLIINWVYSGFNSTRDTKPVIENNSSPRNSNPAEHQIIASDDAISTTAQNSIHKSSQLLAITEVSTPEESTSSSKPIIPSKKNTLASRFVPGFIGKHWRGDYTLAVSYWFVGLCTFVAVKIFVELIKQINSSLDLGTRVSGALIIALFVTSWALTLWLIVGVWRSAEKHQQRGGTATWAKIAKFIVAINLIGAIGAMITQAPLIAEGIKMLAGFDRTPPYKLKVLRNGTELELSGGMPLGTTAAIEDALQANPAVRVIHLNSLGGRISEGYKLYSLIQHRKLITYTSAECDSACTIAFLAGAEKYIGENGKLGFHSTSIDGQDGAIVAEINSELKQKMSSNSVPNDFINHALSTSNISIWYPSKQELLAAKVIDSVVDSRYFGISGIGQWVDTFNLENALLKIPFFSALSQYDRNNFSRLRNLLVLGIQNGRSEIDIQADIKKIFFGQLLPQYLKKSPDEPLIDYWKSIVEQMRYLQNSNIQLCADFAYPEYSKSSPDFQRLIPVDMRNRYYKSLAEMVKESTQNPQVSQQVTPLIQADLESSMRSVYNKNPRALDLFKNTARFKGDPPLLCNATIGLYSEILSLPSSRSGQLLRHMHSK